MRSPTTIPKTLQVPQIFPMYPPRTMTSSHALESSHKTYVNKLGHTPFEVNLNTWEPPLSQVWLMRKFGNMKVSCPQMWYARIYGFDSNGHRTSRLGTEQLHMCNNFTLIWAEEYVRSLSYLVWAIHKRL